MFNRLKIATKLFAGFGFLLLLLIAISGLATVSSLKSQSDIELLGHRKSVVATAQKAQKDLYEARMNIWVALATGDKGRWKSVDDALGRAKAETTELVAATRDPTRREDAIRVNHLIDDYLTASRPLRSALGQNDHVNDPDVKAAIAAAVKVAAEINEKSTNFANNFETLANSTEQDANRTSQVAVLASISAGLVGLVVGVALSAIIARGIRNPIVRLTEVMTRLAGGDLAVAIPNTTQKTEIGAMARSVAIFKDNAIERQRLEAEAAAQAAATEAEREHAASERARQAAEQAEVVARLGQSLKSLASGDLTSEIGQDFSSSYAQIRSDFNAAVSKLKEAIVAVVASTDSIKSGTADISEASEDLSQRTAQQAASLEETASALDQITSTVAKSAESTRHASEIAASTNEDAQKSASIVREAVSAMDAIAHSGREIGQIIGVIDEIAFQTNLLALNAGVEAARAGDAGRGFAVVASEVRALAQRSAEASKDIKGLIATSTSHVDKGVALVGETGRSLDRIIGRVGEINVIVSELAQAAREQATGLVEINKAVNQMDDVTQQNAAMVEESTAASMTLSHETEILSNLVNQFRIDAAMPAAGRRRSAA